MRCLMRLEAEWGALTATVDSGAGANVANRKTFWWLEVVPNEASRKGKYYIDASKIFWILLRLREVVVYSCDCLSKY